MSRTHRSPSIAARTVHIVSDEIITHMCLWSICNEKKTPYQFNSQIKTHMLQFKKSQIDLKSSKGTND
jgi:hypothetical protein